MPNIKKSSLSWNQPRERQAQTGRRHDNYAFYNSSKWRKIAKAFERAHPTCAECARQGKTTDATGRKGVTDHIEPMPPVGNGAPYDWNNLQRLCNKCHAIKSGKESRHGKRR